MATVTIVYPESTKPRTIILRREDFKNDATYNFIVGKMIMAYPPIDKIEGTNAITRKVNSVEFYVDPAQVAF